MSRPTILATAVLASMLSVLPILHLRAEEPDNGATRVTIRSSETKEPIAGARFWLYACEDTWLPPGWRWEPQGPAHVTNQYGIAELLLGPSRMGRGRAAIVAKGCRGVATYLDLGEALVILRPADPVMGVVFDGETQRPLSAVTVRTYIPLEGFCDLCGHDHVTGLGPIRDVAETDGTGRFRLEDGGDGRLLSVECEGYATLWKGVTLDEDVTAVKVMLPRAAGLTGVVREATGRPVEGAVVSAHPARTMCLLGPSSVWIEGSTPHMLSNSPLWKAARASTATTDEHGRFAFDALVPDTAYWLWSRHGDSFGMIEASTVAFSGKKESVDLVLVRLASVTVRVETRSGEPASESCVSIYKMSRVPLYSRRGSTDNRGEITFDLLPPGRYVVSIEDPRPVVDEVVTLPGETEKIVLRLK